MGSDYGFSLTTFSPTGKLVQIEYALNAVNKQGRPALGIQTKDGVVIAAEKKVGSSIIDETSLNKVESIADHIGCVYGGMPGDARVLLQKARKEAVVYERTYGEPIPVVMLVKRVSDVMQEYTQSGGVRPFGCSLLICGISSGMYDLYQVDPSGAYFGWRATAIGKDCENAKSFLERRYREDMTSEDGIHVALLTLKELCEGAVTHNNIQIGVVSKDKFTVLRPEEVRDYLREAE